MQRWMVVTIEGEPDWPARETEVVFAGRTFVLRPLDGESAPDVRTLYEHPAEEMDAFQAICSLLSSLSWWQRRPIRGIYRLSCTTPIRGCIRRMTPVIWDGFALSASMTRLEDERARRAIAVYRESLSLKNTPYEFLGFMKIVNILHSKPEDQIAWINATLPLLKDERARHRIEQLKQEHTDLGGYLYGSGRCAVAHAYAAPVVDPDSPADVFRLAEDLSVARALAEYLIEHELGVPWSGARRANQPASG